MRIISGKYKSKRIQPPKGLPVRPTTDMSRESLFNILGNYFDFFGSRVLDLFSGTGMMAYEFASRGVEEVIAVDVEHKCVQFISKISHELKIPVTAIKQDVFRFLKQNKTPFDIIFADPPYTFNSEQYHQIINNIFDNKLLNDKGLFVLEHSKSYDFSDILFFVEQRNYGSTVFSFFENIQENEKL